MRIRWQTSLAVGHRKIDDDHRHIFELVGRLQQASAAGHGAEVIGAIFCDLADYVVQHFGREERLMERSGFPRILEHRKQHDGFLRRLGELVERHEVVEDGLVEETCEFLNDWLVRHVMGSDQELAQYLQHDERLAMPAE
jgi:hemerythrin